MAYYEIIYETGEMSVANYANETEALAALKAQNDRAKSGGVNGPQGGPATRIAKVFKYKEHPGDFNLGGGIAADQLKSEVTQLLKDMADKNGVINVTAFSAAIADLISPGVEPATVFDSRYKMEAEKELNLDSLGA